MAGEQAGTRRRTSGSERTHGQRAERRGKPTKTTAKTTAKKAVKKGAERGARTAEQTAERRREEPAPNGSSPSSADGGSRDGAPRAASRPRLGATRIAAAAARQLLELTGREAEGVTGLVRSEEGWTVQVEVVEVRRIPDTTDVLALYEVETDEQGELLGYRRLRRYARGDATEE